MIELLHSLLSPEQYIPHGNCYLWQTPLVSLHVISDSIIALSYYSIPALLVYFLRQRTDVPFQGIFLLFSVFILSCGTTHLMEVWTLWHPAYWLSGWLKITTALISFYTAITLVPILPQAISLPSPAQLVALNEEIKELNTELEKRVLQRTTELEKLNHQLLESTHFSEKIAELTPNVLYIYDLIEQKNIYSNNFLSEIIGYTPEEVQAMESHLIDNIIHPLDKPHLKEHLNQCFWLRNEQFLELEYRVKDKQGSWRWLYSRDAIFEKNKEGKIQKIIGIAADISKRKNTEIELKEINQQLEKRVKELENRTQEMIYLGTINDFLQACQTVKEAEKAIADLLKPLFPNSKGAVFMMNSSRDALEAIATWGEFLNTNLLFTPSECWGLRLGNIHEGDKDFPSLYCQHIPSLTQEKTLCIPMIAQGETLGMLYLSFQESQDLNDGKKQLAQTVSKQIGLAFANLKLQESLKNLSHRDGLTGLFNRRYLENILVDKIAENSGKKTSLCVIMMDLDHFKNFNDYYGHEIGDLVLQKVAQFLQYNIRDTDIACRYGGEELTIIMPDISKEIALKRGEELRKGLKSISIQHHGEKLPVITASFGLACFPEDACNGEKLLNLADQALYQAKNQGRDCLVCYQP